MTILSILGVIAYPSYQSYLYKIRRSEAQQHLLLLAAALEDHYLKNHTYENHQLILNPTHNQKNNYDFTLLHLSPHAYTLTATPKPNQVQANDPCGKLSLTEKQILGPMTGCWG